MITTHAVRQGDSWTLSGRKNPVLAGDCADTLVVSAALPDGGTGLFLVDAAGRAAGSPYPTFDGQRGAQIDLDQDAGRTARRGGRRQSRRRIRDAVIRIQSALCAEAVGAMEEALAPDHRIPQDAQAVRGHAEQVPDADPACRRHVRLAGTGPQHELLRRDVDRRRQPRPGHRRRAPSCRSAGRAGTSARRPSSCTAASA